MFRNIEIKVWQIYIGQPVYRVGQVSRYLPRHTVGVGTRLFLPRDMIWETRTSHHLNYWWYGRPTVARPYDDMQRQESIFTALSTYAIETAILLQVLDCLWKVLHEILKSCILVRLYVEICVRHFFLWIFIRLYSGLLTSRDEFLLETVAEVI